MQRDAGPYKPAHRGFSFTYVPDTLTALVCAAGTGSGGKEEKGATRGDGAGEYHAQRGAEGTDGKRGFCVGGVLPGERRRACSCLSLAAAAAVAASTR